MATVKNYRQICVIIAVLCIIQIWCDNPFATREPETPSGTQSSFISPVAPETVFENLKSSILENVSGPTRKQGYIFYLNRNRMLQITIKECFRTGRYLKKETISIEYLAWCLTIRLVA